MEQLHTDNDTIRHASAHYQHCPLEYLQNTTLFMSTIESPLELANLVDEMLIQDNLQLLEDNAEMYLVLSYVLSTTIRRVVFAPKEIVFPNLLLLLPPVYQKLNWCHKGNEEWDEIHAETLARFEAQPRQDEAAMLMFLEGMKYSLYDAMFMYQSRIALLPVSERNSATQLQWDLTPFGWPSVKMACNA